VETGREADGDEGVRAGTVVARVGDEIVYYVHGADANATADSLPRAAEWLRLAAALHAPTRGSRHDARAQDSSDIPGADAGY
jgi:hypothetical protein